MNATTRGHKSPPQPLNWKPVFRPPCTMPCFHRSVPDAIWQNTAVIIQVSALFQKAKYPPATQQRHFSIAEARWHPLPGKSSIGLFAQERGGFPFPDQAKARAPSQEMLCTRVCSGRYFPHRSDSVSGCCLSPGDLLPGSSDPSLPRAARLSPAPRHVPILQPRTQPASAPQRPDDDFIWKRH